MPLAFTSASSRVIVSLGPKWLWMVVRPSAAMACAPDRHIAAINASILRKVVIAYSPREVLWPEAHGLQRPFAQMLQRMSALGRSCCLRARQHRRERRVIVD